MAVGIGNTVRADNAAVRVVGESIAVYAVKAAVRVCEDVTVLLEVCGGVGKRERERGT